jgi:hypothetical protein
LGGDFFIADDDLAATLVVALDVGAESEEARAVVPLSGPSGHVVERVVELEPFKALLTGPGLDPLQVDRHFLLEGGRFQLDLDLVPSVQELADLQGRVGEGSDEGRGTFESGTQSVKSLQPTNVVCLGVENQPVEDVAGENCDS